MTRVSIVMSLLLVLATHHLAAATIDVPAGGDIQAAINSASDGDVIQLEAGVYPTSTAINTQGKAITLQGVGQEATILDGGYATRVLVVQGGEGPGTVFRDLMLRSGHATFGGGAYVIGSSPVFSRVAFSANFASQSTGGGGLYVHTGDVAIEDCLFQENVAHGVGGGMHVDGDSNVTVYNSRFRVNTATLWGGGYACDHGATTDILHCAFMENSSHTAGGAIGVRASVCAVRGSQIKGNTVLAAGLGGGVSVDDAVLVIDESVISNNAAHTGGGIAAIGTGSGTVTGCRFCGNTGGYAYGNVDLVPHTGNCFVFDCVGPCRTDINNDDVTGASDLLMVFDQWGPCPGGGQDCSGDIDLSQTVDIDDVLEIIARWGDCPEDEEESS
ncbi:MAG: right-handed parallel beta-helix repeat-containing protein [Phycisphaerales bacterium]|nr:right-handed parallel beta-helix repeat-containing protein [Phycisphaerales bacterium]